MNFSFDKQSGQFQLGQLTFSRQKFIDFIQQGMLENLLSEEKNSFDTHTTSLPPESDQPEDRKYEQRIYYGIPGCGKSFRINDDLKGYPEYRKIRTVFHPEYTNADFVGQVYPKLVPNDKTGYTDITYEFKPGPLAEALRRAYRNPGKHFFLIIEEINRGNAAAIFGEVFQLLDRIDKGEDISSENTYKPGWSSYGIRHADVNAYIRKPTADEDDTGILSIGNDEVIPRKDCTYRNAEGAVQNGLHFTKATAVRLPPNLSIYATMNTSDQNVFSMDNAFQRRFKTEMISDRLTNRDQYDIKIGDTGVFWGAFREWINERILSLPGISNAEDKCLGGWFINTPGISKKEFAEKVLKYLWNDVFKRSAADSVFNKGNGKDGSINSLSSMIEAFTGEKDFDSFKRVFKDAESVKAILQKPFAPSAATEQTAVPENDV